MHLKDREAGLYDQFRTDAGETYNIECRTFWIELQNQAARATLDYANAMQEKSAVSSAALREQVRTQREELMALISDRMVGD